MHILIIYPLAQKLQKFYFFILKYYKYHDFDIFCIIKKVVYQRKALQSWNFHTTVESRKVITSGLKQLVDFNHCKNMKEYKKGLSNTVDLKQEFPLKV